MGSVEADRIIASVAAGHHATVSRRQLLDAGLSRSAIDRRLAGGQLVRLHAGVYHPPSWRQSLMAAVLAAGSGAVVSHRGAAPLLGIPGSSRERRSVWGPRVHSPSPPWWSILPVTWDDLAEPSEMIDAVRRGLKEKPRHAG
jgi:hypothetical protein